MPPLAAYLARVVVSDLMEALATAGFVSPLPTQDCWAGDSNSITRGKLAWCRGSRCARLKVTRVTLGWIWLICVREDAGCHGYSG